MERYHAASVQSSRSQTLILRFISSSAIGISAMIENARLFASDSLLYGGGRSQRTTAMHGKLALYHPQYGVIPFAVSLLAIIWTTIFLTWIQTYLVADDVACRMKSLERTGRTRLSSVVMAPHRALTISTGHSGICRSLFPTRHTGQAPSVAPTW